MTEVPVTEPTPLLMLVELAFETTNPSNALCPRVMEEGVAVNEETVGAACGTVAEHVVVAIVDEASVACSVIVYIPPGAAATVCTVEVEPLPQRYATGSTPAVDAAVQVMLDEDGTPPHDVVSADAIPANEKTSTVSTPAAIVRLLCEYIDKKPYRVIQRPVYRIPATPVWSCIY